jgi:AcrR family transcriptional regulator
MKTASLSDARAELVRERVLAGVEALLAQGQPLTFAALAAAAVVPERTIYRYYPTREALLGAVFDRVNQRLGVDAQRPTDAAGFAVLVRQVFPGFDGMAPMVRELLASPEGRLARLSANPERQRAALALVQHEVPGLDRVSARRLSAVLQLLGAAATWQSLCDYWGMDGAEAAEASVLASELLLLGARARARKKKKARRTVEAGRVRTEARS